MSDAEEKPTAGEVPAAKPASNYVTVQRWMLVTLVAYTLLLFLFRNRLPADDLVLDQLMGLPVLLLAILWCVLDAKSRDFPVGLLWRLCLIFLFLFAFPLYTYRTRGLRGFQSASFIAIYAATIVTVMLRYF